MRGGDSSVEPRWALHHTQIAKVKAQMIDD
jgi:hypothetical protein